MLQVRVECVACHTTPTETADRAELVGQTFRPTETACLGCHGEKYRGMMARWVTTLAKMQAILAPKLVAARAAVGSGPAAGDARQTRARGLVADAEYNARFVALARGVHNVFYAADLLKLANGWLDDAMSLLGRSPVPVASRTDETLVRGGYCAVLCHEQAGVKQRETVRIGDRRVPHVRHVTEFGAVCTACHSAEVHKAVTATAATCSGCHHSAKNERCEGCHRAQAAFYRGQVQTPLAVVEPNVMADAVSCTACHDFTRKHSRPAIAEKCRGCHEPVYMALWTEWTAGFDRDTAQASAAIRQAETAVRSARRSGRSHAQADALLEDARQALGLVRTSRPVHNPAAAEALLGLARDKADQAARDAAGR
jgi:hypothetical protein